MKMLMNTIKRIAVFVLLLWVSTAVYGQLSKVHYIPPIAISPGYDNNIPIEQWIYVSTPFNSNVQYVITPLGGGSDIIELVSNSEPKKHSTIGTSLDAYNTQLIVPQSDTGKLSGLNNKGYIIKAEKPIYVSIRLNSSAQAGALVSKGEDALGKEFLLGSFSNQLKPPIDSVGLGNFFSVLATQDATSVTINFPNTVVLENIPGSITSLTFNLSQNESYVGFLDLTKSVGNRDGLLGAKISSNKPIVVNSGSTAGTNGDGGGRDFGIDQIVDIKFAGDKYIFIRGLGKDDWENVMIVPTDPNTTIEINPGTSRARSHTITTEPYYEISGNDYINGNMFVGSDKPVVAYQGIGGNATDEFNQGMFYVPPLSCSSRGNVDNIPAINEIGSTNFLSDPKRPWRGALAIVARVGATVEINDGGVPLPTGTIVSGNTDYITYLVNSINGDYSIKSNNELYVSYYTYAGAATSGSFYSGFTTNPILKSDLTITPLGTCVLADGSSNTVLTTNSSYDTYEWQKLNLTTSSYDPAPGTYDEDVYEPNSPGKYKLIGTLDCFPAKKYESEVIVVSLCPDDTDLDGIPDTIDLDRDNDGILNEIESYGKGTIDFSNPENPEISLPDDPTNAILSTGYTTPTSANVTGNSTGQLTSVILPTGINEKTTYKFNPILPSNLPLNIRLEEVAGSTNSDFETFTVVVYPPEKNITVLDPGEKLLIDDGTGFKRVPSVGISGNQLKFKYNPIHIGSAPFELFGIDIEGIDLIHELGASATSDATLKIMVEIIDYDRNTDSSDEIDALDDDSDNDSCPDKTESGLEDSFPTPPFTFNTGTVDERGRIILTGSTIPNYPDPERNASGDFLFLTPGTPIPINAADEPQDDQISEGDSATFTIGTTADQYQWQMNGITINDSSIFSGTTTQTLTVNTTDTSLDGKQFSVLVNSNTYLCKVPSSSATLSVLALPPIPVLDRVYSFCGAGTVKNLKDLIDPTGTFNVYDAETGGSPLPDTDTLLNGEDYYVSAVNAAVGESVIRSFTNVVVADPALTSNAPSDEICLGESVTLTAQGVPYTFSEFEDSLDPSFDYITSFTDPVTSEVSHYFLKKQSMSWTAARAEIKSLGSGASMYVINSKDEEEHVFNAMSAYTGTEDNHFWLGLRQIDALANGKFDEGWVWLDGRPLTAADANWYYPGSEPNDYDYTKPDGSERDYNDPPDYNGIEDGSENFAQFDFTPGGDVLRMEWNDMKDDGGNNGKSWPVFEFQGVTQVKWYKQEGSGPKTPITGLTSNSMTVSPTVTTTYFYEIDVNGTPCDDSITITVNPLPAPLSASDMELCDNNLDNDPTDANEAAFDLDAQRKKIIFDNSATDRDVFFYETNTKALSVSDSIPTATPYTSNPKDIYYRVVNKTTGCFGADADIDSFALIVNDLPPILSIEPLRECDDDIVGNDKDGLHKFDLTQKDADVKDALIALGKDPADYTRTYHALENDTTPITTYTTVASDAGEKEIFVRIEDNKGCVRYDNSFKVIVDKLPELLTGSITIEQCEKSGGITVDLTDYNSKFSSNHTNEEFTFFRDRLLTIPILNPSAFSTSVSVPIYVSIKNKTTDCTRNNDALKSIPEIVINLSMASELPPVISEKSYFDCYDSDTSTTPGIGLFDRSIFIELKDMLEAAKPSYKSSTVEIKFYESEKDAELQNNEIEFLDPSLPQYSNINNPYKQEIWAGIQDNNVTIKCLGRIKVATLYVEPLPKFEVPASPKIFCLNDITDEIKVTSPSGTYDYSWTLDGNPLPDTTPEIVIDKGGIYEVTATDNLSGCTTTKTVEVKTSEMALFDAEDVTIYDLTGDGKNRVEIDNSEAALGIGDYEFALELSSGLFRPYQDSPIFEDVPPGIHTLYVRDINKCGTAELKISVVGYSLYFTPNGDGKNDTWQILGVSKDFQATALIYIFDRHGRLMAQIPATGVGWDGTYNGNPLPADDYWFRVKLDDGRSFTDHFSLVR